MEPEDPQTAPEPEPPPREGPSWHGAAVGVLALLAVLVPGSGPGAPAPTATASNAASASHGAATPSHSRPAKGAREEPEPTSGIAGRVFGPDGRAARGVRVTVAGSGVWPPLATDTDARGRFRVDVPPGIYDVRARKEGLVAKPREGLSVAAGHPAFVALRLSRGNTLAGEVVDAKTGKPIAHAEVTVTEGLLSLEPRTARTDAEGAFRLRGLEPHPYRLTVAADGYVARVAQQVRPAGEDKPERIALERAAAIAGVVMDSLDRPVAGARLEVVGRDLSGQPVSMTGPAFGLRAELTRLPPAAAKDREPGRAAAAAPSTQAGGLPVVRGPVPPIPASAPIPHQDAEPARLGPAPPVAPAVAFVTDAKGRFEIRGVPPGQVQILAHHPDHAPAITDPMRVVPGQSVEGLQIVLPEAGEIDGRVVDARGFPVGRVPVQLRMDVEPGPRLVVSATDGTFEFDGVRGTVVLAALPKGQAVARTRLEVGAGQDAEVVLRLPNRSDTLRGRTVDSDGFPVAGAQVTVQALRADAPIEQVALSAGDGTFAVPGLPGPPYRLTARAFDYAKTSIAGIDADQAAGEVRVVMRPGAQIAGLVRDGFADAPLAQATVRLQQAGRTLDETRTDASGHFEFLLVPEGKYYVLASHDGFERNGRRVALQAGPRGLEDLKLDPIELQPGGRVTGSVTDRYGEPVGGAQVAIGNPPDWSAAVRADAEGHFTLDGVPPGEVHIEARHPAAGRAAAMGRVVVRVDSTTDDVLIRLPERYDPERAKLGPGVETGVAVTVRNRAGGVVVARVKPGSGAERAGLQPGDVIEAVDGVPVDDAHDAADMLEGPVGADALLDIRRGGEDQQVMVPRERYLF